MSCGRYEHGLLQDSPQTHIKVGERTCKLPEIALPVSAKTTPGLCCQQMGGETEAVHLCRILLDYGTQTSDRGPSTASECVTMIWLVCFPCQRFATAVVSLHSPVSLNSESQSKRTLGPKTTGVMQPGITRMRGKEAFLSIELLVPSIPPFL